MFRYPDGTESDLHRWLTLLPLSSPALTSVPIKMECDAPVDIKPKVRLTGTILDVPPPADKFGTLLLSCTL